MKRILLGFILYLVFATYTPAQEYKRVSLRGIKAVGVMVERIDPELEKNGITVSKIQNDVELTLRKSSIKVLDSDKEIFSPYLYISIDSVESKIGLYAISVQVMFYQEMIPPRDTSIQVSASTWRTGSIMLLGKASLEDIRNSIKDHVEEFANDFLARLCPIFREKNMEIFEHFNSLLLIFKHRPMIGMFEKYRRLHILYVTKR